MQGQLRRQAVEVEIKTVCAHCNRPLLIRLDSAMRYQVASEGAEPLLFEPGLNWATFTEPNIIHAY